MRKVYFVICFGLITLNFPSLLFSQSRADSIRVRALNNQASAATLYSLDFTLSDTLYPDSVIEVAFPAGFDLSKVDIAGSKTINGGLDVEVRGQTVYLKRKGRGSVKNPGDKVDLKFSIVKNPATAESSYLIKLKLDQKRKNVSAKELLGTFLISGKKSVIER